jgi:hypothetical protein
MYPQRMRQSYLSFPCDSLTWQAVPSRTQKRTARIALDGGGSVVNHGRVGYYQIVLDFMFSYFQQAGSRQCGVCCHGFYVKLSFEFWLRVIDEAPFLFGFPTCAYIPHTHARMRALAARTHIIKIPSTKYILLQNKTEKCDIPYAILHYYELLYILNYLIGTNLNL